MKRSETSIKTERLWLRQIDETDAYAITSLRSDEGVYRFFFNPVKLTLDEHNRWYQDKYIKSADRIDWIAVDDGMGAFIGVYGARKIRNDAIQVSYITSPNYKKCGYASEAVVAIMAWCKVKWNACYALACIHSGNLASIHFANRLGFKEYTRNKEFIKMRRDLQ